LFVFLVAVNVCRRTPAGFLTRRYLTALEARGARGEAHRLRRRRRRRRRREQSVVGSESRPAPCVLRASDEESR